MNDDDVLVQALTDAIDYRLDGGGPGGCGDCTHEALCEDHAGDRAFADQYGALLDALRLPPAQFPMPGNHFPGSRMVIASCTYRDLSESDQQFREAGDDWPDLVYVVLLLNSEPPYYTVAHINPATWEILESDDHPNIIPAAESYQEIGGAY